MKLDTIIAEKIVSVLCALLTLLIQNGACYSLVGSEMAKINICVCVVFAFSPCESKTSGIA